MAVNEGLAERVRALLAGTARVAEKRMFRGIAFLVDGKLCLSVGDRRLMCRIDPEGHAEAVKRPGARTVVMAGRPYAGYVYVDETALKTRKDLKAWVDLALEFNPRARSSRAKRPGSRGKTGGRDSRPGRTR